METTLENSAADVGALYNDFIQNGKMELLHTITGNKTEYYAVLWYTEPHVRYRYLVGQKVKEELDEKNIEIKIMAKGTYCRKQCAPEDDAIKAWTEFYDKDIPEMGFKPKETDDIAFEYYPNGFDGEYELWSLVE
ncbi:effector binding domain-containing protein [Breznakiella homolactica]|uniref:Integron-associated effector binding protein domain-containing protein n=1 Tax=Breznakiella homolactica TaxID=2798577 RepID=A0A7T7XJR0_9SPIR|nr:effector binding domain-containing protein [Breznakiella homolactica]